jgi:transposase
MSDMEGLAQRRERAGKMFDRGVSQADVARELEVSRETASRWYKTWAQGGTEGLAVIGQRGRSARLSAEQLEQVEQALLKGAVANGFANEVWTAPRVTKVIEHLTGESYHPGHVWRILRQMGWSLQRPARRAAERDDEAVEAWIKDRWPKVKKTPDAGGRGSSSRTNRASR